MPKNVTLSDDFDQPQGLFLNYDAYDVEDRMKLYGQKHVDIRSMYSDELWTFGAVSRAADRNRWQQLEFTALGGQTTVSESVIGIRTDRRRGTQYVNLIKNPSSELTALTGASSSSAGQAASTTVRDTSWAKSGTHSSLYTVTRTDSTLTTLVGPGSPTGASGVAVVPGRWYAARLSRRWVAMPTNTSSFGCRIYWYTAAGASSAISASVIGPSTGAYADTSAVIGIAGDRWIIAQAPSDAAFAAVRPTFQVNAGGVARTYQVQIDALALFDLGTATPPSMTSGTVETDVPAYFDGDKIAYRWTGAAHSSTSEGPFEVDTDAIDMFTQYEDDDFISLALPAFDLANIDEANSWIDFTSEPNGDFITGPVASLRLSDSIIPLVQGDSEFRVHRSGLVGIDLQQITGVRFRITASTTTQFRAMALRLLGKTWLFAQHDIDTRLGALKPTVAPNGAVARARDWTVPPLFRSSDPPNTGDPKPIDLSVAVAFNSGTRANANAINLFFRETALDFTQMIDLDGTPMSELDGEPMPNLTSESYRGRMQRELNRFTQEQLDDQTQLELERTPDPFLSSYLTAMITWQGSATRITLQNSDENGFTFTENIDGLAQNANYIFIVDVENRTMRARLYPLDNAGNITTTQLIFDTGKIYDPFAFTRRAGRFGWTASLADGDAYIDSIRTRRQTYAELQTQPFASITPVEGCELFASFSPPLEYFEDAYVTDEPITTATVTRDQARSTTGISYRIDNPGTLTNQGIQTNLADFHDFNEIEISFDVYYPSSAVESGITLKAFLSNDKGRVINLPMGNILPDRWHTVKINPGNPTAQTGRYRLYVVQEQSGFASTWWIDNIHIRERLVSFYGRSVLEDPWGDARVDWVPFRNTLNKESAGVQFLQRGNHLQIMAKAHRQSSRIDSIRAVPKYAHLGRLVWDEDELYNPQRPVASYTITQNALTVTFNATASSDADGEIINYQWAFGDGGTASGPITSHTYRRAGTYTTAVTVTDSQGLQSTQTQTIFVTVT